MTNKFKTGLIKLVPDMEETIEMDILNGVDIYTSATKVFAYCEDLYNSIGADIKLMQDTGPRLTSRGVFEQVLALYKEQETIALKRKDDVYTLMCIYNELKLQ